ncbi:MAG: glycosyltransferase family 4 protein [Acidimicrobiales bacterium]|nr:glycosyltransferase family 4 protein [Acidimicrobiales bacterium]
MESIGINLLWLEPGVVGGSENYTLSLLRAVHDLDPLDLELVVYGPRSILDHHPDIGHRFEFVVAPNLPAKRLGRVAAEHTWLSRHTGRHNLMHYAGGVLPKGAPAQSILTILDLQPLDMPQNFGRMKRSWLGQMIPRSVDDAKLITVPSMFTAQRLEELLGVPQEVIRVVPFGVRAASTVQTPIGEKPVVLYPAIAYAHKRHCDLIDAFVKVRAAVPDARLVLTGGPGPLTDTVQEQIVSCGLGEFVEITGWVSEPEMQEWYSNAAVLAFPSEYEGFGLPVLEAMNHSTPVVVADAGSLPEIAGPAATVVPVRDPDALARAIVGILINGEKAASMAVDGAAWASRFTWRRAGEALISAYRDALV